jgi:hypothetical protein
MCEACARRWESLVWIIDNVGKNAENDSREPWANVPGWEDWVDACWHGLAHSIEYRSVLPRVCLRISLVCERALETTCREGGVYLK